jgi:hypothetical protein
MRSNVCPRSSDPRHTAEHTDVPPRSPDPTSDLRSSDPTSDPRSSDRRPTRGHPTRGHPTCGMHTVVHTDVRPDVRPPGIRPAVVGQEHRRPSQVVRPQYPVNICYPKRS